MAVAQAALELSLEAAIGFSGDVRNGLTVSPCGQYLVYALGSNLVVRNLSNDKQCFLAGHSGKITCLTASNDGHKLASGQASHSGVKAEIIIWNFEHAKRLCDSNQHVGEGCIIHRLSQHLGRVQDLAFSFDSRFLASLGGRDDNAIVVWDVEAGHAVCGAPAASEAVKCVKWYNNRSDRIVTAGTYHVKVWFVDFSLPKLHSVTASMGSVRRVFECISVQEDDSMVWCGSQTGDVIKLKLDDRSGTPQLDGMAPPTLAGCSKDRVSKGVSCIHCIVNPRTGNTNALVGGGDGTMVYMNTALNIVAGRRAELMGGITAMQPFADGSAFYCGTDQANRYVVSEDLSRVELKATCHTGPVHQLCFPRGCSDLVVSCSTNDIRVWNLALRQELLRIQVPNLECLCCQVTPSGAAIVSGWDDGKIRSFFPESGRLKFVINDAHMEKVTALAISDDDTQPSWRIVSGGHDGRVRVWSVTPTHQRLMHTMKEHRGPIQFLKINHDGTQCVSASADGSCIVWDLERYVRYIALFEPTVFEGVVYHPDESQILTCGTHHKLTYWDAVDGNAIRVVTGGERAMTSLDIDSQGEYFFTGSEDSTVKVWHYDDGIAVAVGRGHSGTVNSLCISPDHRKLVSAGSEGSIFIWSMPRNSELAAVLDAGGDEYGGATARSSHEHQY